MYKNAGRAAMILGAIVVIAATLLAPIPSALAQVDPKIAIRASVERWLQGPEPEVRGHRERVAGQRRAIRQVRLGVGRHRRADVSTLGVDDHQRTRCLSSRDGPLEDRDAGRAVGLEERRLRLEHRDHVAERVDHAARDSLEPGDPVLVTPGLDDGAVRVDADAQPAPRSSDGGETLSVRGHEVLPSCRALMPATRPTPE